MPKIHDWKHRGLGNDYIYRPNADGTKASMTGWRRGLRVGDMLALYSDGGKNRAAYVIDEISYYRDPPDMFEASVHYERGLLADVDGSLTLGRNRMRCARCQMTRVPISDMVTSDRRLADPERSARWRTTTNRAFRLGYGIATASAGSPRHAHARSH